MSPRLMRSALVAALVVLVPVVGACGGGGKITIGKSVTPETTETTESETTEPDTTEPDTTEPETTEADSTGTTSPLGGGLAGGVGSGGEASQEAPDVSWGLNAAAYRGQIGLRVAYDCPPGGVAGSLWGTSPFTDDSSVCTAALYSGLIDTTNGGRVVIEIAPGASAYASGEANGAIAYEYGEWGGSFVLLAGG